jgi:EPTP domain
MKLAAPNGRSKMARMSESHLLRLHQALPTSGARRVAPFEIEGTLYLGIPQLSEDVAGTPAHMNGGNSDIEALIYRWRDGGFEEAERLAVPGGEDVAFFCVAGERFLATASIRTGSGPYDLNATSTVFRRQPDRWVAHQSIETFAAKQCYPFMFDGRCFLGLAQGVTLPGAVARHPRQSRILEWDGVAFREFQTLEGRWGYGFCYFEIGSERYLAYADHVDASVLYRWDGQKFAPLQSFAAQGGRAYRFFLKDNAAWLAFANISGESTLYRWDGGQFVSHQSLGGPGGREFELFSASGRLYLVRVCFIEGTPAAPKTDLMSQIYRWDAGGFHVIEQFPTFGGTDAAAFTADGQQFLAVANSLTADVRFRQDTLIYRLQL